MAVDQNIEPALLSAARDNRADDIAALLEAWENSESRNPPKDLPMHPLLPFQPALYEALKLGHIEAAGELMRRGCFIDADAYSWAIRASTADGKWTTRIFDSMLQNGWDINRRLGMWGDPITDAVYSGNVKLVRYFLDHGADPNLNQASTPMASRPLEAACFDRRTPLEIIELLVEHGADVRESMSLWCAANKDRADVLELLLRHGGLDVIDGLCNEYVGSITHKDDEEFGTALHGAAHAGCLEAARLLLERGARTDVRNAAGFTPIEVAERAEEEECVKLLREWASGK